MDSLADPRLAAAMPRLAATLGGRTAVAERRLGGLTNANYVLCADDQKFVLRLPGAGTGDYIDRRAEEEAARATAEIGVNAEVLFFDARDGMQLSRFIGGATMSPARFKDFGAIARAAMALRKVHQESRSFAIAFEPFDMIGSYEGALGRRGAALPDGYAGVTPQIRRIRDALSGAGRPLAPCHCDPLCENFIDTGETMYVIDWEYAGNNDPLWDLGDWAVEAVFSPVQEEAMMSAYFGGAPPAGVQACMVLYKALCDILWAVWGAIQHADNNPAEDFWAYAAGRLARAKRLMATAEFEQALQRAAG